MKLIRLSLENFRQHRATSVEFRDGMTAIVGANGSGKSTLLEAVTFALFGEQRQTKDSIRFHWAGPKDRFRVELIFTFGGRTYVVERTDRTAELRADGQVIAEGLREVKGACERLLRLTHDQFINSFCAEQKSLEFLKFKNNTTRQNEVARMLGLDRLKEAGEFAKAEARRCRDKAALLEEDLGNREELDRLLQEADARLATETAAREIAEKERTDTEKRAEAARKRGVEAETWLEFQRQILELRSEGIENDTVRKTLGEEVERLKKDAETFAGLADFERRYQEAVAHLAEQDALSQAAHEHAQRAGLAQRDQLALETVRATIAESGVASADEIDLHFANAGLDVNVLQRELSEADEAWRALQRDAASRVAAAQAQRDAAAESLARAQKMQPGTLCPECGQEIRAEAAEQAAERAAALQAAEALLIEAQTAEAAHRAQPGALAELAAKLEGARKAAAAGNAKVDALRRAFAERDALEARLGAAALPPAPAYKPDEHAAVKARVVDLLPHHERFVSLQGAKTQHAQALKRFAETHDRHQQLKKASDALKADQAKQGFGTAAEAEAALADLRTIQNTLSRLIGEATARDAVLAGAMREREAAAKRVGEHAEKRERIRQLKVDRAHFDTVNKEMLVLRERLNQQIRPDLEARASDNLQALSGGRYTTLELDEQFEATVLDDGVHKAVISGGEEDIVALSLRLALSELIQERQGTPLCLLILDEVFGSLDGERRQAVMERLAGLKGRFEQILVISHIEEINQVADQCVYLVRDEGSKSTYATDSPLGEAPFLVM